MTLVSIQIEVETKRFLPAVVFWVMSGGGGRLDVDGGNTVAFFFVFVFLCCWPLLQSREEAVGQQWIHTLSNSAKPRPEPSSISTDPATVKTLKLQTPVRIFPKNTQ